MSPLDAVFNSDQFMKKTPFFVPSNRQDSHVQLPTSPPRPTANQSTTSAVGQTVVGAGWPFIEDGLDEPIDNAD